MSIPVAKLSVVHATPDIKAGCKHEINKQGRINIAMRDDEMKPECVFGLPGKFPPNYDYPEIKTGFSHMWDMFGSIKRGDIVSAQISAQRYTETPVTVKIPYGGKSCQKRDVSTHEKCFFEISNLVAVAKSNNMTLRLLNPSTGTITRLRKMNILIQIVVVDGSEYERYSSDLEDRMSDEKYFVGVSSFPTYADIPHRDEDGRTILYYCGTRADKAYMHKVKNFVGFALDPYSFTIKGDTFVSYENKIINNEDVVSVTYIRENYETSLYHYANPRCFTYAFDSVHNYLSSSKYGENKKLSENWRIMSTIDLRIPELPISVMVPPSVDVVRYDCYNIELQREVIRGIPYQVYFGDYGDNTGRVRRAAFDVKSAEILSRRQQILKQSNLPLMPASITQDYTVELYPFISHPVSIKFKEVFVNKVASKTTVNSYACDLVGPPPPDFLISSDRIVFPRHISTVQPINVEVITTHKKTCAVRVGNSYLMLPGLAKSDTHYDFVKKKGVRLCKRGVQNDYYVSIIHSFGTLRDCSPLIVDGYFPEYGETSLRADFWSNGQSYVKIEGNSRTDDTIVLFKVEGGLISDDKGNNYDVHVVKTHMPTITLQDLCMRDTVLNRNQYMMICGGHIIMGKFAMLDDIIDSEDVMSYEPYEDF